MRANATGLPAPAPAAAAAPAEAVTTLYQAHALGLIRLAVVMLGDRPAAEDVVQEAFCGLYRRWHSLADTGKALAYVRSSVINGCRTVLRRRLRQRGVDPLTGDPPGESAEATPHFGPGGLLGQRFEQFDGAVTGFDVHPGRCIGDAVLFGLIRHREQGYRRCPPLGNRSITSSSRRLPRTIAPV